MTKVRILNTDVDNVTMEEAVDAVRTIAIRNRSCGGSSYVVTPNLDHLVNLEDDPGFAEAYRGAELVLPDGLKDVCSLAGCTGIKRIVWPQSLTDCEALLALTGLETVEYRGTNEMWEQVKGHEAIVGAVIEFK